MNDFFQIFHFNTENVTFKEWGENLCFFQILNFSNCLTLSSHISGLQALIENFKIVLKFSVQAL